jgi:HEAT repeat protein
LTNLALSPDGRLLAQGGPDGVVHLWDVATGNELAPFKGQDGKIGAVLFSPDGKTLVSAHADTTAVVWDLSTIRLPAVARPLTAEQVAVQWKTLMDNDAAKAFVALHDLAGSPMEALAFLQKQLEPVAPLDRKRVQELIARLDDDQPSVRQEATRDLTALGEPLLPILDKTLAGNPSLEARRLLGEVRKRLTNPLLEGQALQRQRAVEVLERIGTPEARHLLETLAKGAPEARLTREARAALERLGKIHRAD